MRENRPYGSEGGAARKGRLYPYPGGSELELADQAPPLEPKGRHRHIKGRSPTKPGTTRLPRGGIGKQKGEAPQHLE